MQSHFRALTCSGLAALTAISLAGCAGARHGPDDITGLACQASTDQYHQDRIDRLAEASILLEKAKSRKDPASLAFGRRLSEFGRELVRHRTAEVPSVAEYMAAFEATLIGWELERGVDRQEARSRARSHLVLSLPKATGNPVGDQKIRNLRDSLLTFDGVRELVQRNTAASGSAASGLWPSLSVDTAQFFSDIESLADAVADTTRVGTATLSESQYQYNLRAPNWTDTTLLRQLSDAHTVFDTLRLFLDDVAFAAWLADTTNLTPVYSVNRQCGTESVLPASSLRATACPPCWAVAIAVAKVAGAGAAVAVVWEIASGILSGDGGDTEDIVEAAAVGAASGVAAMGLHALLLSQYAVYGWGAIGAAIATYFYMN